MFLLKETKTYFCCMFVFVSLFVYGGFFNHSDSCESVKKGILAVVSVFLFLCTFIFNDGLFVRPHPAFWKIILGFSVLYFLFLLFFLFQSLEDARQIIRYIAPSLTVPIKDVRDAENCKLTLSSIYDSIDFYAFAHLIGWYVKAILLRDYFLCWCMSFLFELVELSLVFQLKNFEECWWDSILLDVFFTNALGIYFGMKTCEYFRLKEYSWIKFKEIKSIKGKIKRTVEQFTPFQWTPFEWKITQTFKSYFVFLFIQIIITACDINFFYFKYLLYIPKTHPLGISRVVLHVLMGAPAIRETYAYLHEDGSFTLQMALSCLCILLETFICIKFSKGQFPESPSKNIVLIWKSLIFSLLIFLLWRFVIYKKIKNRGSLKQK